MASKPNPAKRAKRIANKAKNEQLRKEGNHPKQLRDAANRERYLANKAILSESPLPVKARPSVVITARRYREWRQMLEGLDAAHAANLGR